MNTNDHKVTLANGTEVSWDEFSTWSRQHQQSSLFPSFGMKGKKLTPEHRKRLSEFNAGRRKGMEQINPQSWHDAMKAKVGDSWGNHSESHKRHMSKVMSKPVMTPYGRFETRNELVQRVAFDMNWALATARTRVGAWFRDFPSDYYYLEHSNQRRKVSEKHREHLSKLNSKPIQTPKGVFRNCKLASEAYDVCSATMYYWVTKSKTNEFYYVS